MPTAKTDQTMQMPRLIWVFTGCTGHFVGFVMCRLIYDCDMAHVMRDGKLVEPRHDKTNKVTAKTQISLGIRPVWSDSSLSAWRKLGSLATHWAHSKDWSAQADLSLRWAHTHFVGFVMSRLSLLLFYRRHRSHASLSASCLCQHPRQTDERWVLHTLP